MGNREPSRNWIEGVDIKPAGGEAGDPVTNTSISDKVIDTENTSIAFGSFLTSDDST